MKQTDTLVLVLAGTSLVVSLLSVGVSYKNRLQPQRSKADFFSPIIDRLDTCANAKADMDTKRQVYVNMKNDPGNLLNSSIYNNTF